MNQATVECMEKGWQGPIPVGDYYLLPQELSDPTPIGDMFRSFRPDSPGDWGDFRIRIHPKSTTESYGRDNFFLHGGRLKGSAGCIDVGGGLFGDDSTDKLVLAISMSKLPINLKVVAG